MILNVISGFCFVSSPNTIVAESFFFCSHHVMIRACGIIDRKVVFSKNGPEENNVFSLVHCAHS